jgi:hypothetical protein
VNLKCRKCGCQIKPGQLYIRKPLDHPDFDLDEHRSWPRHVACPNEREIAHAKRMGREP